MSSDTSIQVENLSKCYQIYDEPKSRLKQFIVPRFDRLFGRKPKQYFREFWALRDLSFEVKRGETVGIIGRNGSGKSTLLQMICGTLNPSSGNIQTSGRVAALLELGSGFNPEFTGSENVYMNGVLLGLDKKQIDKRFDAIVAFADIGDFISQPVKTYSSGMLVRLAFAVIAHVDADILVIDEALAVGDAFFTQKCMRFLRKFKENGTILFVSHDTGAVVNLCQKAIWLENGICKEQGEPKSIAQHYLADLYVSRQGDNSIAVLETTKTAVDFFGEGRDMRMDFINSTGHRNDLELFEFNSFGDSFGKGGGNIMAVRLLDVDGFPLSWVVGGESVKLQISCRANVGIFSPIIGFFVNDRLGQPLFGDNTYNFTAQAPLQVSPGEDFEAEFNFRMPILPLGDYSITVALAEGTQQDHVQHHWIHTAILLKSHSSSVSTGLVGVPMNRVRITKIDCAKIETQ